MRRWLALFLLLFAAGRAGAHPLAPALLELREAANGQVDVLLKTSLTLSRELQQPVFPSHCRTLDRRWPERVEDSRIERWQLDCGRAGLAGARIAMSGDQDYELNVVVSIARADGTAIRTLLSPATPSFVVPARESLRDVLQRYVALGVEHLLTGLDHLLFVLGLLLWLRGRRALLGAVTAFTLGHSVTLALATLDLLRLPSAPVELGIALSILWLAIQLSREPAAAPRATAMQALALPCAFGLLHGLGFAGALGELGLPAGSVPLALFGFNLGIELGQLGFIGSVWLLCRLTGSVQLPHRALARAACIQFIGVMAALWCWQRGWGLMQPM